MAVLNGRVGKLSVAALGDFDVGVQQASEAGAKYQVAMPPLKTGRQLVSGQIVQLDGESLKVLSVASSAFSRAFMIVTLAPVA